MHPAVPRSVALLAAVALFAEGRPSTGQEKPAVPPLASARASALDRISADSLRGHLSFLASDLLEGRDTPSKGLDLAAEYIAAQFRRAGLEPAGDDGYFQTATFEVVEPDRAGFAFRIAGEGGTIEARAEDVALSGPRAFRLADVPLVKVEFKDCESVKPEDVAGKAILIDLPDVRKLPRAERLGPASKVNQFRGRMSKENAALVIAVMREPIDEPVALAPGRLVDPEASGNRPQPNDPSIPTLAVHRPALVKLFDDRPAGPIDAKVTTGLGEPSRRPVKLRNVAGILRGSDPALKETVAMVTAHYDHVGVRVDGPGPDRIFNGANDDGSGTVSVVEIASALGSLKPEDRPRRSILFVTFFGEEKGLLGSRYYGRHPLVPVEKTVADFNLEQVGRTDDTEGPQVGAASLTGFGYSAVSTALVRAGEAEGIAVKKHPKNSDAYFGASDNQALADLGVPAHTVCVAFQYPDYHAAGDHWDKVDYANMARIDRMVARALLAIADDPDAPKWDESNPRAAKYLKAWKERHKDGDKD